MEPRREEVGAQIRKALGLVLARGVTKREQGSCFGRSYRARGRSWSSPSRGVALALTHRAVDPGFNPVQELANATRFCISAPCRPKGIVRWATAQEL